MNDYQPDTAQQPIAFCQNCGKSLDSTTVRRVGTAVYCEPCLEIKLGHNAPPPPDTVWHWGAGMPKGWTPGTAPNPGLAALLGLIPGVGAMYNEQYAKGVVHLGIFAVLVMLTHASGIFLLFVFGWIAYMSIEAHHTATARRNGTPLPNPFGFNDIGERMGFGASWPHGPNVAAAARDAVNTAAETINAAASNFTHPPTYPGPTYPGAPSQTTPPFEVGSAANSSATWGAPTETYNQPYANPNPMPPINSPYAPPYTPVSGQAPYNPVPPYASPYVPTPIPPQPARFPAGAVWLIGLGSFFLLSTLGVFSAIPKEAFFGVFLLMLGCWIFFRRMTETGLSISDDGSPDYRFRVLRAIKGSIWLAAIGALFLLSAMHLLRWEYSWPVLIILAGVLMIVQRGFYNSAAYPPPTPGAPSQTASPFEVGSTEPTIHHDDHTQGGL